MKKKTNKSQNPNPRPSHQTPRRNGGRSGPAFSWRGTPDVVDGAAPAHEMVLGLDAVAVGDLGAAGVS